MVKTFIKYWSHVKEEDTHHFFSSFLMDGRRKHISEGKEVASE